MRLNKTILAFGLACAAPMVAVAIAMRNQMKIDKYLSSDSDGRDLVLECFDEMIEDIKQMHKHQKDQDERLTQLEESLVSLINKISSEKQF